MTSKINNKLISIIIPVYNVEKYLDRCLSSVISQDYLNTEIIIINDGSTDSSLNICREYEKKDDRIIIIDKPNGGLSSARNAGLDVSSGEYITFIDSDDWVSTKYVSCLYNLLETKSSDVAVINFRKVYNNKEDYANENTTMLIFNKQEALIALSGEYYENLVISCGKLFKKSFFDELRFPLNRFHEDEFMANEIFTRAKVTVFSSEQHYYYWQREDSIMGSGYSTEKRIDVLEAFKRRLEIMKNYGFEAAIENVQRGIFGILRDIYKHDPKTSKLNVNKELRECLKEMRRYDYDFIFKIKYEFYFISKLYFLF